MELASRPERPGRSFSHTPGPNGERQAVVQVLLRQVAGGAGDILVAAENLVEEERAAERHLRRVLSSYVDYYQGTRTHLSLDKDCPDPRPIMPRRIGKVVAIAKVGGLHHRYERLAA